MEFFTDIYYIIYKDKSSTVIGIYINKKLKKAET